MTIQANSSSWLINGYLGQAMKVNWGKPNSSLAPFSGVMSGPKWWRWALRPHVVKHRPLTLFYNLITVLIITGRWGWKQNIEKWVTENLMFYKAKEEGIQIFHTLVLGCHASPQQHRTCPCQHAQWCGSGPSLPLAPSPDDPSAIRTLKILLLSCLMHFNGNTTIFL